MQTLVHSGVVCEKCSDVLSELFTLNHLNFQLQSLPLSKSL